MSEYPPGMPAFLAPRAVTDPIETTSDGLEAQSPAPDAAVPRHFGRRLKVVIIVGIVVVAMIAAALTVWLVSRSSVPTASPCVPTTKGPGYIANDAGLPVLPIDLLDGVPSPDQVTVTGVWCGVAVVDLGYHHMETSGSASVTFNTDILRAFDVSTGALLWTLDKSPDGSALLFGSAVASDGKLALATGRWGSFLGPAVDQGFCSGGTDVRIIDLRTGRVLASTFADAQCEATMPDGAVDTTNKLTSVVAYEDGIVVTEQGAGHAATMWLAYSTAAYSDADLSQALWTVKSLDPNGEGSIDVDRLTDRTLPGGWVRTVANNYVEIASGSPSGITDNGFSQAFFAAGDMALEADSTFNTTAQIYNPWDIQISGWPDLSASDPAWTYTPPDGWVIAQNLSLIEMPYPYSKTPVVAVTSDAIVIMEMRFENLVLAEANLTAISKADGTPMWTVPYKFDPTDLIVDGSTTMLPGQLDSNGMGSISFDKPPEPGEALGAVRQGTLPRAHAGVVQGCSSGGSVITPATQTACSGTTSEYVVFADPQNMVLVDAQTGKILASQPVVGAKTAALDPCGTSSACLATVGTYADPATYFKVINVSGSALDMATDASFQLAQTGIPSSAHLQAGLFQTEAGLFGVIQEKSQYEFMLI